MSHFIENKYLVFGKDVGIKLNNTSGYLIMQIYDKISSNKIEIEFKENTGFTKIINFYISKFTNRKNK